MRKFIKFIFLLIIILAIASTVFFLWASSPQKNENEYSKLLENSFEQITRSDSIYSIITYNIGYLSGMTNNRAVEKPKSLFDTNLKRVKKLLISLNADVLAFQEIDYGSARSYYINQQNEIAKLGYNYVAEAVNWDETYVPYPYWPPSLHFGEMLSGQSILSKFPLSDQERIVLERVKDNPFYRDALYLERLAQVVKTTIENKVVVLINVHLEAFNKTTRVNQFNYVLKLFEKYAKEYPTILLGDFNSRARNKDAIIHKLFEMPSVGNAAFKNENPENTFDSREPKERIDYIFYTKDRITYIDGKILNEFGEASDHLPVLMRFKLK